MAQEIQAFAVTTPAGTSSLVPQTASLLMPPRIVDRLEVRVPSGPRGRLGWRVGASGTAVLPVNAGAWIVTDDEVIAWDLEVPIDSGGWELQSYNTGTYNHTVYLRFLCRIPGGLSEVAGLVATGPISVGMSGVAAGP